MKRNYGIDLLRLVAMYMVVVLHVLGGGKVLSNLQPLTLNGELLWSLEIACYVAVNVFAIISGFVGYNSIPKYKSIILLSLQLAFYAIICTTIEILFGNVSLKQLVFHLFPFLDSKLWYFSAYFILFFFMPILNLVIEKAQPATLRKLTLFILLIFCCFTQIYSNVSSLNKGYSFLWLAILYVLGGCLAKYNLFEKWTKLRCFFGYLICIAITCFWKVGISLLTMPYFNEPKGLYLLVSYTSPTIVLAAMFLVCGFAKMEIKDKWINVIKTFAPLAFGVYLIHNQQFVWDWVISCRYSYIANMPSYVAVPLAIFVPFVIFSACLAIDWIRSCIFKAININKISGGIEHFFATIFNVMFRFLRIPLQ